MASRNIILRKMAFEKTLNSSFDADIWWTCLRLHSNSLLKSSFLFLQILPQSQFLRSSQSHPHIALILFVPIFSPYLYYFSQSSLLLNVLIQRSFSMAKCFTQRKVSTLSMYKMAISRTRQVESFSSLSSELLSWSFLPSITNFVL